jgi:hypothetical protein
MASDPPRPGDVSDKAIIELRPIAIGLRRALELDDHSWELVAKALTQALMAGVRIGGSEVAAQAIESGLPVTLNMQVQGTRPAED